VFKSNLRKVGGSVMLSVPPAVIDMLHLEAGQTMGISVDGDRLILQRKATRPRYTLEELLSQCDADAPLPEGDRAWLDSGPVGLELL
jgi:antitoxin ChpS